MKYIKNILIALLFTPVIAFGAWTLSSIQTGSSPTNGDVLTTDGTSSTWSVPNIGGATSTNPFMASYFVATSSTPNIFTGGFISQASSTFSNIVNFKDYFDIFATSTPSNPASGLSRFFSYTTQGHTRPAFLDDDGIVFTIGEDSYVIIRNTSGSSMTKGQVVYQTGSTGNVPNVSLAKADSLTTLPAIGILLQNLDNNNYGYALILGVESDIDTSSFSSGDRLFVSTSTAGAFINTRPSYPYFAQRIGSVSVSGVGNGSIRTAIAPFVGGEETGTVNDFIIGGNATSTGKLSSYSFVEAPYLNATSTTATSTFSGGLTVAGGLGVGTTSPYQKFSVVGNAVFDSGAVGTTTQIIGKTGNPACLALRDTDNGGWTYCYTNAGTMTCSTTSCQ